MNPYDCSICHNEGYPHDEDCPNHPDTAPVDVHAELSERVLRHGVPQAILAARTGFSLKHVNEMLNFASQGTLDAWSTLITAAEWGYDEQCFLARRGNPTRMR